MPCAGTIRYSLFLFPWLLGAAIGVLGAGTVVPAASEMDIGGRPQGATVMQSDEHRFYVGADVCRRCHDDGNGNGQFSAWYRSAHARAYAVLSLPASNEIARLSGIDTDVFESPICLGCHATAADTEPWEREPTFHLEHGVQCEFCHGPGSAYADARIMADPEAARIAGLRMPDTTFCARCHAPKGSHETVLGKKEFDAEAALKKIKHAGKGNAMARWSAGDDAKVNGPRYVGAMMCAGCHKGAARGYAFGTWRLSAHAGAYAVLGESAARSIARSMGVTGDPRASDSCLVCHTTGHGESPARFASSFAREMGVQCESCHGPGGDHDGGITVSDGTGGRGRDFREIGPAVCERCHTGVHGNPFRYEDMRRAIDHSLTSAENGAAYEAGYKTPMNLALSPDGGRLFVTCEASDSVIVVDTDRRIVRTEIFVGNQPNGISLSPDGTLAFVSNRGSDTVSVIDVRGENVIATIRVGDEPHGVVTDAGGETLYVANAGSHDVSVVDLRENREIKRLAAGRGTWDVSRSADGRRIFVTNNLSQFVKFRTPLRSEVTVIDAAKAQVEERITLEDANLVQGVDVSPDGAFALVTLLRTKNLVPITRILQGWVITNGIGILWKDGRVDQLLLDEPEHYFADPTDVAITPDGNYAYVTGGGVNAVAVIDLGRLKKIIAGASEEERTTLLPNHLGLSTEFVVKRIAVGSSPRGVAVSSDGRTAYVADGLDDTISVIDVGTNERVAVIDLGGRRDVTLARDGERVFHSADIAFGRQFSCHSCHPDGGVDAVTYDIEADGLGVNPVDNRSLRGILDTAPFKWTGKNATLSRQCGPRLAVFFTRVDPFTPEQVKALERYICTIPRNPNRYRSGRELTAAQRRGRALFSRTHTNAGKEIPEAQRCATCHWGPYHTNRTLVDVGTRSPLDTQGVFDVPHLNNIYESAPYLHDGRSETLEEIWTVFNPDDTHGVTNDMTKDQLNDLIEYLKML